MDALQVTIDLAYRISVQETKKLIEENPDAYATAFMVLGLEDARKVLDSVPEIQAYLIYADEKGQNQTYASPGLQDMMEH